MAQEDSLEAFEALHRDLEALRDHRLPNIDRLWIQLEERLAEFKQLLEHNKKNEKSRSQLSKGTLETAEGVVYTINQDFQQQTIQIADELDLDELEAAQLFLRATEYDSQELDRSPIVSAVIRFHSRRQYLLECLRMAIEMSQDDEFEEDDIKDLLKTLTRLVLDFADNKVDNGSKYWQKCLAAMQRVEADLQRVSERFQRASVVGQTFSRDEVQIIDYERTTLNSQHESLAAISALLVRQGYTAPDDFRSLLTRAKKLDRHDVITIHYLLVLMASVTYFGSSETSCPPEEATALHKLILADRDTEHWGLRRLCQAVMSFWITEYKGRFPDAADSNKDNSAPDSESSILTKALKEGGLQYLLSISQDFKKSEWHDPAKVGLTSFLLRDVPLLPADSPKPAQNFQRLLMEQLQNFVDAFITNMPDTLRLLKYDEDDQRKVLRSRFQNSPAEYQYHLDTFLVLVAYAYEGCPEAAQSFWSDPEGNLYGFLQWAAKRQTTPRVAAFCEMLRSLSEDAECADAAHQFLLEEGAPLAGKLRRNTSMSWNQIFAELEFYSSSIKDRPAPLHAGGLVSGNGHNPMDQIVEPESAIMLECYLRLVSHLGVASEKARTFLLNNESPSLPLILFHLCGSKIDSRLRGCSFVTLGSMLVDKTPEVGAAMWTMLDQWIAGGISVATRPAALPSSTSSPERAIFKMIFDSGFEEPNAFVRLLNALAAPNELDGGLNDALPFPENLGSPYRLPGIDIYVDFAVGKVFGEKTLDVPDPLQLRLLRLSCLDFICSCLASFNEDLVIIANQSNIPVEAAMRSSSLAAYVRLHPFARVMEWLFEDKVLDALFAASHQDVDELNRADGISPLVLSTVRSIEAMNLILKLQATYLDIVRPLIKRHMPNRKPVSPSAMASFEDAVLKHLDIVVDLGLYCGLGHEELTMCSLGLLEKLSSSRKLIVSPAAGFGQRSDRSKLIGILEKDGEGERISRAMVSSMAVDERELEAGPISAGYMIKTGIISFLQNCLATQPDRPNIAHHLLGFTCRNNELEVGSESLFAAGNSLFHAVARLALDYPEADGFTFRPWLSNIKEACTEILRKLWRSPLSCALTMTEFRASDYIFSQAVRQRIVATDTKWDEKVTADPEFILTDSALALRNFLRQRTAFYDYFAREIRVTVHEGMTSLRTRLQSTLLGSTTYAGEQPIPNATVFDLLDFMELEYEEAPQMPPFKYLDGLDWSVCGRDASGPGIVYDLGRVEEVILLRRNELQDPVAPTKDVVSSNQVAKLGIDMNVFEEEARLALLILLGSNQRRELAMAHGEALKAWVQLMIVALESFDFDPKMKEAFVQQTFQMVLPKFEKACSDSVAVAIELAGLLNTFVKAANFSTPAAHGQSKSLDVGNDRLLQMFRIALNAVSSQVANLQLRELCYPLCYQYLHRSSELAGKSSPRRRNILRLLKVAGDRLLDVVCDDAYSGQGSSRVAATLLLDALVAVSAHEQSPLMLETFGRLNFVGVLVDNIKQIPDELRQANPSDVPALLTYHSACLALLLRVSQNRVGASQVLNAGLFKAVRDSKLFSADPDIGLEIENPDALRRFFDLMLSVLRIINSVILSRGQQNDQTLNLAREFLRENRHSIVAVFKRNASIGGIEVNGSIDLNDLVDNYTLLISATGFLEFEEKSGLKRSPLSIFS